MSSGGSLPRPIAPITINSLPIVAPIPPYYNVCNELFGSHIQAQNCLTAGSLLPTSDSLFPYYFGGGDTNYDLPWSRTVGTCRLTVSVIGVAVNHDVILRPNSIREMAGYVINQCVTDQGGRGGMITGPIEGSNRLTVAALAAGHLQSFVTVMIENPANDQEPAVSQTQSEPADLLSSGDLMFDCETELGTPNVVDCSQIEYSQLGSPYDSVNVGPGTSRTLSQNSCNVKISASTSIVITWEQIQAAIDALINVCVANPIKQSMGGIAYFGGAKTSISGKRRKRATTVTSSNALPPGVNVTITETGR